MRRADGVIELDPRPKTDPSQAWFWTERWQKMEREVEQSYARGDCETFETGEDFMAYLERLDAEIKANRRG